MPRLLTRAAPPVDAAFEMNRDSPQARGLVGWWPTIAPTASVLWGYGGSCRSLLGNGSPGLVSVPGAGRLVSLDGSSQNLQAAAGSIPIFQETTPFSVCCWFASTDTAASLVCNWDVLVSSGWRLDLVSGKLRLLLSNSTGDNGRMRATDGASFGDGALHHVVATYDGSSASAGIAFYVDGMAAAASDIIDTSPGTLVDKALTVGDASGTTHLYLAGLIGNVRIYNRALSPQEVWQLWAPQTRWELYRPSKWRTIVSVPAGGAPQTLSPTAAGSGEQAGTPTLAASIALAPTGGASDGAGGTPSLMAAIALLLSGGATSEQGGTPAISAIIALAPTAAGSDGIGGTPALSAMIALVPAGGASGEAGGTPIVLPGALVLFPTGAQSDAAGGTPVVTLGGAPAQAVAPTGAASSEQAGSPSLTLGAVLVGPLGGASDGSAGTPGLTTFLAVLPVGAPSGEQGAIPAILALIVLAPSATGSGEQCGVPAAVYGAVAIIPLAAASLEVGGLPIVLGGVSGLATGSVTITVTLADGVSIATAADTMTTEVSA